MRRRQSFATVSRIFVQLSLMDSSEHVHTFSEMVEMEAVSLGFSTSSRQFHKTTEP